MRKARFAILALPEHLAAGADVLLHTLVELAA